MRYSKIDKKLVNLIYFAQIIDEMLFDHTIDTYRIPALNSALISIELKYAIRQYQDGHLNEQTILPIIDELIHFFKKDIVVEHIFKNCRDEIISKIGFLRSQNKIHELEPLISYTLKRLKEEYFASTKKLLKEIILNGKKSEIRQLARIFITELVRFGFSPSHIYFTTANFFFDDNKYPYKIKTTDVIEDYFKKFSEDSVDWNVIMKFDKVLQAVARYFPTDDEFAMVNFEKLKEKVPNEVIKNNEVFFKNDQKFLFMLISKMKGYDTAAVRESTEGIAKYIDSILRFHRHKRNLKYEKDVLIYQTADPNRNYIVGSPKHALLKRPDRGDQSIAKALQRTFNVLKIKGNRSFSQAIVLHKEALDSPSAENQLLNLWTALEVIFPPEKRERNSRMSQISAAALPFLAKNYTRSLIMDLNKQIRKINHSGLKEIMDTTLKEHSEYERFVGLMILPEFEEKRKSLAEKIEYNPLVCNRMHYIERSFGNPKRILQTLNTHLKRIEWQIIRVYRVRNMIVHSYDALPYLDILIENLHTYIDQILNIIVYRIGIKPNLTINHLMHELRIELDSYKKLLAKNKEETISSSNFKELVLGLEYMNKVEFL